MKNKKIIIISAALALAAGGVAVGGTYALFTSGAANNVQIDAGKVAVSATFSDLKLYSKDVLQTGTSFENGGTAVLSDGNLSFSRMTPGDKAVFTVNFQNLSNVKTKYVYSIGKKGDLAGALVVTGAAATTDWTNLDAGAALPSQEITVEMPLGTGNDYQGKSGNVFASVFAIQQNADVSNYIVNAAGLKAAFADGTGTETKILANNIALADADFNATKGYFLSVDTGKTVSLDLNGRAIDMESTQKKVVGINLNGSLTIQDTSMDRDGEIALTAAGDPTWAVMNATINNYAGKLVLNSGVIANYSPCVGVSFAINSQFGGTITMNAGKVVSFTYAAIRVMFDSTTVTTSLTVNAGEIEGYAKFGVYLQNSACWNGSFTANLCSFTMSYGYIYGKKGGVFLENHWEDAAAATATNAKITLSGGMVENEMVYNPDTDAANAALALTLIDPSAVKTTGCDLETITGGRREILWSLTAGDNGGEGWKTIVA